MTIYYLLIGFIGVCSIFTIDFKNKYLRDKIIITLVSMGIILIQGLRRKTVGVDLIGYIPALKISKNMDFLAGEKLFNYEIGYSFYSQFFAKLNISDQLYLLIVAMTIIIPIGYTWIKNSKIAWLSIFIYVTLGFFTFTFSGLRQSIAFAITFYSYKYIKNKNLFKFLICIILAISFHASAVIFIAAYPLRYAVLNKRHYYFIVLGFIMTFIFRSKIFLFMYRTYNGEEGKIEGTNAYTMLFIMIIILIISYIFGSKDKNNFNLNIYKNYMLVSIFLQIFASQSNVAMRTTYYYYLFITLLIPEVMGNQRDKRMKVLAIAVLVIALLYFFHITTGNGYLNVSPYYFYWE